MVLKLYAGPHSTCSRRVAVVLIEKQVPFELIPLNLDKMEQKDPEFLKKQPFGQVPYIDDDGFILFESRAIGRYIATKYANQGTKLIPTDIQKQALFEQAASIEASNFDPFAAVAYFEKVVKPRRFNIPTDETIFNERLKTLSVKLDAYDVILGKQKYLAGDEFTLADLFHLPLGAALYVAGSNILDTKPNVSRWWKDISSRPSWKSLADGIKSTA